MTRNKMACVLLCVLGLHAIQVQALLNITEEAINFSRKITEQAQQVNAYQKTEDLENQIGKLAQTLNDFHEKSKRYIGFLGSALRVPCDRKEIDYACFNIFYDQIRSGDSRLDMDYRHYTSWKDEFKKNPGSRFDPQIIKKFVVENDVGLVSAKTYNDFLNLHHSFLTAPDPESGLTLIDVLTGPEEARRCKAQSQQLLLFNLIREISGIEVRGFAVVQFSLAVLKALQEAIHLIKNEDDVKTIRDMTVSWADKDIIKRMKQRESDLISRNTRTYDLLKSKSRSLDRLIRKCSDETRFKKLPPIFQKYIINEVDMDESGSCQNTCPDFKEAKARGCYDQGICAQQTWCNGTLWDCGNNIGSPMLICPKNSHLLRYQYVQVNGNTYGEKKSCEEKDLVEAKNWTRGLDECTYCMCTCENANTQEHYSFSLRPVESDIQSNLVIANFQLEKLEGIFHIHIEQSELLPNGTIGYRDGKRTKAFTVSDPDIVEGKDYHSISWKKRVVSLDMISGPPGHVLTGLQLALQDDHILKLKIRVTAINFITGKLYPEQSQWLTNDIKLQDRINLDLQNLREYFDGELKKDAYFHFTTSALETDVGQSTIPSIETDPVGAKDTPLSGAGLYLRNVDGNIVLALEAETFDYSPNL